ncbi:MAG: glycoside hydrolase family 127 protein [Candidatus Bathyarchaeia archaeon]
MPYNTVIIDTSSSPYAKLHPIPIEEVRLEDGFWAPRLKILREVTIPSQYSLLESTGRIDNFRRAARKVSKPFSGLIFNDSDVYKWIEAVAFLLAYGFDENLYKLSRSVVEEVVAAQDDDGYLNTYFMFEFKNMRWRNLRDSHELYCAGHLMQAGVAYYRSTGRRDLLDSAIRFADNIYDTFVAKGFRCVDGHPEVEMALVELYRTIRDSRYLDLACFFIDNRGLGLIGGSPYHIDHKPFRELSEIVGHAVRALYLNCGATDVYMEIGDDRIWEALQRLWRSMVYRKMYITGGVGSRYEGEAFGDDYELPNYRAYSETCAAIASFMWNWRMLNASMDACYTDIMELALYNAILSGISLDGRSYFYVNPLADRGRHRRQDWFTCACCPPNIARLIASIPGYIYSKSVDGLWVNLYIQSTVSTNLECGRVRLKQVTDYPWDGRVKLIVEPEREDEFSVYIRIPGWCRNFSVEVDRERIDAKVRPPSYLEVRRVWRYGDYISLYMDMPVELMVSHPWVTENSSRVSIVRGPLVYCVEQVDNEGFDIWDLAIDRSIRFELKLCEDFLGRIVRIVGDGYTLEFEGGEMLYTNIDNLRYRVRRVRFNAIPYYAWANRGPGSMIVWIRLIDGYLKV